MPDCSPADGDDADRYGAPFEWNRMGLRKDGNCTLVMEPSRSFAMPVCPRVPGVQLPSGHGAACPFKRGTCNLTCYGLLRPVTANDDGRQFIDGDLARQPGDSVVFLGNGVWGCSLHEATLGAAPIREISSATLTGDSHLVRETAEDKSVPDEQTLLDKWISRVKNHPLTAIVCFVAVILAGLASFTSNVTSVIKDITDSTLYKQIFPSTDTVVAPRKFFKENFEIEQDGSYIGDHHVFVKSDAVFINPDTQEPEIFKLTITTVGATQSFLLVKKGYLFLITRADCDRLEVLIKDVKDDVVQGTISGKCAE